MRLDDEGGYRSVRRNGSRRPARGERIVGHLAEPTVCEHRTISEPS